MNAENHAADEAALIWHQADGLTFTTFYGKIRDEYSNTMKEDI